MTTTHTLTPGTKLVDEYGSRLTIDVIHEDGSLDVTIVDPNGPTRGSETWSRRKICDALMEGRLRTNVGSSSGFVREE